MTTTIRADASGTFGALQHNGVDSFTFNENGILGVVAGTDAAAGIIGEYVIGQRLAASPVSLTSTTPVGVISISLTAGDWDVQGQLGINTAATTTVQNLTAHIDTSVSAATVDTVGASRENYMNAVLNTGSLGAPVMPTGVTRISLSAPATVYLVGRATFAVSTMTAFSAIRARRVR